MATEPRLLFKVCPTAERWNGTLPDIALSNNSIDVVVFIPGTTTQTCQMHFAGNMINIFDLFRQRGLSFLGRL